PRHPERPAEGTRLRDVRAGQLALRCDAIAPLRRHRDACHGELDAPALGLRAHARPQLGLPGGVFARGRDLHGEEALVHAAHLDRQARRRCVGAAGAVAGHAAHQAPSTAARSSLAVTLAVPTFPTTTPAAWLASIVASSSVPPAPRASAQVAITV